MTSHSDKKALANSGLAAQSKVEHCSKHHYEYTSYFMFGRWLGCHKCANEMIIELDKKREVEELNKRRDECLKAAHIPEKFTESGVKNYETDTEQQVSALSSTREYLTRLRFELKTAGNLILSGRTGNGKTHLACAVLRTMAHSMYRVRYITSAEMLDEVFATWEGKKLSVREVIIHFASYDVLVIDEIGVNDSSKKAQEYLSAIIDARYLKKMPTIIISNLLESDIHKTIGDRCFDRLCENGQLISFEWESYRQRSRRSVA